MRKKIYCVLLSFFGFSAYGELHQVTADMLVGNWRCVKSASKIINYNEKGDAISYETQDLGKISLATYKKGSNGMTIVLNNKVPNPPYGFKIKDEGQYTPLFHDGSNEQGNDVRLSYEYSYISNDEYKLINNIFFRGSKSKQIIRENHSVWECARTTK
ncbi:hypothetical protein RHO14_08895 [Orbus wheelerorum]|uniref:hypothetical protein n=1 Tax=Orbus wheelerorum TaxID=3074111 RepID=UPI00370D63F3